jgi:heme A synthase
VLLLLPPAISIAHACLGQTVFCLVVVTAWATAPVPAPAPEGPAHPHLIGWWVPSLFFVQLLLGAIIRHTGYVVLWHMGWGLSLWVLVMVLQGRIRRWSGHSRLSAYARGLTWLVTLQVLMGLLVYAHRSWVPIRTLHLALGALVLAQAVLLAAEHERTHAH